MLMSFNYDECYNRVKNSLAGYEDLHIRILPADTGTAEAAAKALGTTPGQIAKTLCFLAEGKPVLIVACGDRRIDSKKFAKALGVKKLRMADAAQVEAATGFLPGGVCPFALPIELPVYLDRSLYDYEITYIAAGTPHSALPITAERLEFITGGNWVEVTGLPPVI